MEWVAAGNWAASEHVGVLIGETMATLEDYRRLRDAQKSLNRTLLDRLRNQPRGSDILTRAAKEIGYRVRNGAIMFDSEAAVDRLCDYLIYEPEANRKSIAQRYLDSKPVLQNEEMQVLQAAAVATTSLYQVDDIDRANKRFRVRDLLRDRPDLWLTDVGLSSTLTRRILLFARVFEIGDIAFVSGAAIAFESGDKAFLLEMAKSLDRIKNEALRARKRYALFVRLERISSIETTYS